MLRSIQEKNKIHITIVFGDPRPSSEALSASAIGVDTDSEEYDEEGNTEDDDGDECLDSDISEVGTSGTTSKRLLVNKILIRTSRST